ncbi:hypothetical protein AOLI_G00120800 [Acnodon oligacanthus]
MTPKSGSERVPACVCLGVPDDPRLQLKVENRLKNIFVTQSEDISFQNTEHAENVNHIPVITESSGRILDTGVNTLQRTLVLKKQVQVDEVNRQLIQKRLEFKGRMQALEQKRAELLHKQQETKERAEKFEKFVEENEVKRRRALKKYQVERKQNELKEKEKSELSVQLEHLQKRHQCLKERVDKYKIYEVYLMKILDLLPENYLEYGVDTLAMPIIRRHETLSITQQDLLQRLASLAEELDQSQRSLDSLKQEHTTNKLMTNKELSELQTQWDQIKEKNKQLEMTLHIHQGQSRDQVEEIGSLLIAVKNLGQQCHLQHYGPLEDMNLLTMMDMMKEFILEKADMERRALRLTDSGSELTKGTVDRGRKASRLLNTMDESGLVSVKEATSAQVLEESDATKSQEICHQFGFIRRVKGDGNCFYRAFCFRLVETLVHNESAMKRIKDKLLRSHEELLKAGFDEKEFKDLLSTFLRVLDQLEADDREETLLGFFNDQATSDSMVKYLRLLTSAHLQNHSDFFQHFVEAPSLKAYCTQEVEAMAMECDHVEILALSATLDISLCIISMDSSNSHPVYHTIPEGSQPSLYLLYKTSHYDILYKCREH